MTRRPRPRLTALIALLATCAGCSRIVASPSPPAVRMVAVLPVDNRTGSELYADAPPLVTLLGVASVQRITVTDLLAGELAEQLTTRGFAVIEPAALAGQPDAAAARSPEQAAQWLRERGIDGAGVYAILERWDPNEASHLLYVDVAIELFFVDATSGRVLWHARLPATPISGGGSSNISLGYPEVARRVVALLLEDVGGGSQPPPATAP